MGLRKAELFACSPASWAVAGGTILASLALQLGGTPVRNALMYDRPKIADGEFYRLASAHFVHLDWRHLALNLAGLLLIWVLVGHRFRALQWLVVVLMSAALIDACFWWLLPDLRWYVGLSGVLHGLLVAGSIALLQERRGEAIVLLLVVAAKLAYESTFGPMPGSTDTIGGTVITESHLSGAVGGAIAAAVLLLPAWLARRSLM